MSETVLAEMLKVFVEGCGVSAGLRTIAWDMAWDYMKEHGLGESADDLISFAERVIPDWEEYKDYDVVMIPTEKYSPLTRQLVAEGYFSASADLEQAAERFAKKMESR